MSSLVSLLRAKQRTEGLEDAIEYALFPDPELFRESPESRSSNLGNVTTSSANDQTTSRASEWEGLVMDQLRVACLDIALPHTEEYIWHKEPFSLSVISSGSDESQKTHQGILAEGASGSLSTGWVPLDSVEEEVDEPDPEDISEDEEDTVEGVVQAEEGTQALLQDAAVPCHLYGRTRVGDNVEDEWFVVWLLLEITRKIPGLTVAVRDADGDFLLIEAAYAIPAWLSPSNSTNRVFLRQGKVHIIPRSASSPSSARNISSASSSTIPSNSTSCGTSSKSPLLLPHALAMLRQQQPHSSGIGSDHPKGLTTEASDGVQLAISRRLKGYPGKAKENVHTARCRLPLPVAQVLDAEPQLVALAVDSFYHRDVDSMKAASRLETFFPHLRRTPPSGSGDEFVVLAEGEGPPPLVDVMVRFSRAMFAQLSLQPFQAPRGYPMPFPSDRNFRAADLGMKLTCGFEMMYAERAGYLPGMAAREAQGEEVVASVEAGRAGMDIDGQQQEAEKEEGVKEGEGAGGEKGESMDEEGSVAPPASSSTTVALTEPPLPIPDRDVGWARFKGSLERMGYFRGLLEGSKGYKALYEAAQTRYQKTDAYARVSSSIASPVRRIREILRSPATAEDFPPSLLRADDDETWLQQGEEELDREMEERRREGEEYEKKRKRREKAEGEMQEGMEMHGEIPVGMGKAKGPLRNGKEKVEGREDMGSKMIMDGVHNHLCPPDMDAEEEEEREGEGEEALHQEGVLGRLKDFMVQQSGYGGVEQQQKEDVEGTGRTAHVVPGPAATSEESGDPLSDLSKVLFQRASLQEAELSRKGANPQMPPTSDKQHEQSFAATERRFFSEFSSFMDDFEKVLAEYGDELEEKEEVEEPSSSEEWDEEWEEEVEGLGAAGSSNKATGGKSKGADASFLKAYSKVMEKELRGTSVGHKLVNSRHGRTGLGKQEDPDVEALKNLMQSLGAQQGLPGPASSLLDSMGVKLPKSLGRGKERRH